MSARLAAIIDLARAGQRAAGHALRNEIFGLLANVHRPAPRFVRDGGAGADTGADGLRPALCVLPVPALALPRFRFNGSDLSRRVFGSTPRLGRIVADDKRNARTARNGCADYVGERKSATRRAGSLANRQWADYDDLDMGWKSNASTRVERALSATLGTPRGEGLGRADRRRTARGVRACSDQQLSGVDDLFARSTLW